MKPPYRFAAKHWGIAWVLFLTIPGIWLSDRSPPFEVLKYLQPGPVRPGAPIVFSMPVRRDVDRGCSVYFSRHIIDSAGIRYDYGTPSIMTPDGMRKMDEMMGPWVRVAVTVPAGITPGEAILATELEYRCNPLHTIWPIRLNLAWGFTVL